MTSYYIFPSKSISSYKYPLLVSPRPNIEKKFYLIIKYAIL